MLTIREEKCIEAMESSQSEIPVVLSQETGKQRDAVILTIGGWGEKGGGREGGRGEGERGRGGSGVKY